MELLPRYSLETAAYCLGCSIDVLLRLIREGSLSIAVDVCELPFGYIHLETRKRTYENEWLYDFEDLLDEDNTAYAYLIITNLSRYNGFNRKLKIADRIPLRSFDTFSKYPVGHPEAYNFENFFERYFPVKKDVLEQIQAREELYTFPTYITRNALLSSPITKQMLAHAEIQQEAIQSFPNIQPLAQAEKIPKVSDRYAMWQKRVDEEYLKNKMQSHRGICMRLHKELGTSHGNLLRRTNNPRK